MTVFKGIKEMPVLQKASYQLEPKKKRSAAEDETLFY